MTHFVGLFVPFYPSPDPFHPGEHDDHIPFGPFKFDFGFFLCFFLPLFSGFFLGIWYTENFSLLKERPFSRASTGRGIESVVKKKRTTSELRFIVFHNFTVCIFSLIATLLSTSRHRYFAVHLAFSAFSLEIAYELFDLLALGSRQALDPETMIHHIASPLCILFSIGTTVDVRVLCHLMICIDASGALLALIRLQMRLQRGFQMEERRSLVWHLLFCKGLLEEEQHERTPHELAGFATLDFSNRREMPSLKRSYRIMFYFYLPLRIIGPGFDTALILYDLYIADELFVGRTIKHVKPFAQTYIMCMSAMNLLNAYFCRVIFQRGWSHRVTEESLKIHED